MTQSRLPTHTELATEKLIEALDRSPRTEWRRDIMMAMEAVFQSGYATGYRTGQGVAPATPHVSTGAGSAMAVPAGEDKALSGGVGPDEEIEDLGWAFIKEIARHFGLFAKEHDLTPGSVETEIDIIQKPGEYFPMASVKIFLKNPTIKSQRKGN